MPTRTAVTSLLDADRDLARAVPAEQAAAARRTLAVRVDALDRGSWKPSDEFGQDPPAVGLLVLDGLITREISFADRTTSELLGTGDLLRPQDHDSGFDPLPVAVAWHVLEPARIAVLDGRFALSARPYPGVMVELAARTVRRSRALAFQLALSQLTRVDDRLLVLFWQLAERWGRVGTDGVRLPLELTHRTLGRLVGARRPSVTTALSGLARDGLVERIDEGWLLRGDPAEALRRRGRGTVLPPVHEELEAEEIVG
ncbi:MAG TPA: Crp/Fnr family transcriptional regulator [Solirubrobacteraceae bacterium]|nr:Crp/Fnr family transcriptional regulator [Solirubrobacteraceae bacterium]